MGITAKQRLFDSKFITSTGETVPASLSVVMAYLSVKFGAAAGLGLFVSIVALALAGFFIYHLRYNVDQEL